MAIRYVIGSEGSGKTDWIYREMLRVAEEQPERAILYLVPDQATLQAQKELVSYQRNGCVMNIDILSFSRLKYRLSEELGDCFPTVLDDIGKSMILKKVLLNSDSELTLYGGKYRLPGFISEVKSVISEFQRYLVDEEALSALCKDTTDGMLSAKLSDFSLILKRFREALGTRFMTEEDVYSAMCEPIARSEKLRHAYIYLNGFTGFTPSQYLMLRSLLQVSDSFTLALTMDAELYGQTLKANSMFRITAKTIDAINRIAEEEGISFDTPVLLSKAEGKGALAFLKNHLFRRDGKHYSLACDDVTVCALSNRQEEVRYLLTNIERLVRTKGYRYREIAVICGDVQTYAQDIEELTETKGIPCFIDYKTDVMNDPLIDFLRSALRVLTTDFRQDAVTHYTKNRLSGYDYEEACLLENYLLAKGIRGYSSYRKPFRYRYRSIHPDPLGQVNVIREKLLADLGVLRDGLRGASLVSDMVRVFYDFLCSHKVYENMDALSEELSEIPSRAASRRSEEYRRIYKAVIEVLERMNDLMGELSISIEEFAEVLEAGFRELKIGYIPPENDAITVGDVKRSRLNGIRHLFLIGINEGVVPGNGHGSELLTEKEREQLKERSVELSDLPKENLPTEEFYLYLACAKPAEGLTLTCRKTDDSGKESKPSYILYRILGMLDRLEWSGSTEGTLFEAVAGDNGRRAFLRAMLGEGKVSSLERKVLAWFSSEEGRKYAPGDEAWLRKAKAGELPPKQIHEAIARALYGQRLKGSVSTLEAYAECGFRSFLQNGLKLEPRPEYEATSADIGDIVHTALERYSERVRKEGLSFVTVSDSDAERFMNEAVDEILSEDSREIFHSDRRTAYLANRIRNVLKHMTGIIKRQLSTGVFEPSHFEKRFSFSTEHMEVVGKIDRIDSITANNRTFLKLVDYKSSDKELSFGKIYEGRQVQLPLYMDSLLLEHPEAIPAAMLYQNTDDPYVECDANTNIEEARIDALSPSGFVINDREAVGYMDASLLRLSKYKSQSIPVKSDKDGQLTGSSLLSETELRLLSSYALSILCKEADEILAGDIKRNPCRNGQNTSCTYCNYKDFCTSLTQKELRSERKMSKTEFFEAIAPKDDDKAGSDTGKEAEDGGALNE